ncbi:hypothetical protein IAT40_002456 [Kwoniella sp. CBS 6097]
MPSRVPVRVHQTTLRQPKSTSRTGWLPSTFQLLGRLMQGLWIDCSHALYLFVLFGNPPHAGDEFDMPDIAEQLLLFLIGSILIVPVGMVLLLFRIVRVRITLQTVFVAMRLLNKSAVMVPSQVSTRGSWVDGICECNCGKWNYHQDVTCVADLGWDTTPHSINGIATTGRTDQVQVNSFASMFDHPMMGLKNQSFGLMIDLWCCLLQRDFYVHTPIVHDCFAIIGGALLDPTSDSVVVLAHSQGGLLLAAIIRMIETEPLLQGVKAKLEVFTLGSAARSFGRWEYSGSGVNGGFKTVEHYSNEWDWVSRTGVLVDLEASLGTHYIRKKQPGHLPLTHYFGDEQFLLSSPGSKLATYLKSVRDRARARKNRRKKAGH